MKRYWLCVAVAGLALAVVASTALVQEAAEGERRPGARQLTSTRAAMTASAGAAGAAEPAAGRPGTIWYRPLMRTGGAGWVVMDYSVRIRDLSPEQRRQIGEIRRAALAKIEVLQKQMNADIKKLLTPAQVKVMEEAERSRTHRGPDGVTLTDAQKKILDDARADAGKVQDREARAAILQKANETIRATFTDEQKKQAAERRERFSRQRRERVRPARPARVRERQD